MKLLLFAGLFSLACLASTSSKANVIYKAGEVLCQPDASWSDRERRCEPPAKESESRKSKLKDKKTSGSNNKKEAQ